MLPNKIQTSVVHSVVLDPSCPNLPLEHDLSSVGTAPVTATPVAVSITATVVPKIILPTNAMGSPSHLIEVLGPGSRTPYDHLLLSGS